MNGKDSVVFKEPSINSHTHDHEHAEHANVPPWQRPAEPDHPLLVEGGVIDGDTELMFRCMVEEYLLAGYSPDAIHEMCGQPNYQAFYAAVHSIGPERAQSIIADAAERVGRHRVRFHESGATAQSATLTIGASAEHITD